MNITDLAYSHQQRAMRRIIYDHLQDQWDELPLLLKSNPEFWGGQKRYLKVVFRLFLMSLAVTWDDIVEEWLEFQGKLPESIETECINALPNLKDLGEMPLWQAKNLIS